jgi:tRNA(fMet)-specific endonuclease VapC
MILDTTFFIDVLRGIVEGNEQAQAILEEADSSGKAKMSALSVLELAEGIYFSDATATERKRVVELLDGLHEVTFNREMGMLAGELSASPITDGQSIEYNDITVGTTARVVDEPVVTRNVDHFECLDGVEIVTY